jgi:hypothetical protein
MATYKGKACTVVRTKGKHKTIRFSSTGSTMTVPASRLNKGKAKKAPKKRRSSVRSNKGKKTTRKRLTASAAARKLVAVTFYKTGKGANEGAGHERRVKKYARKARQSVGTKRRVRRTNPWVSFEGHGRNKGRKKAGKRGKRPGVKRAPVTFFASSTRARGRYASSSKPRGYVVVGTRKYGSKAAYTKAQKRRGKALTKHLRRNR